MILSHSVMHARFDPDRCAMLELFLDRLGEPTAIVYDDTRAGIYDTAWRAWEAYDPKAAWHIVFQDDMHPCRDTLSTMRSVLAETPNDAIVSFFQPAIGRESVVWGYVKPWFEHGPGLREYPNPCILWGGSIAVPTRLIPRMLSHIRRFMPKALWGEADDEKICFWAWKEGLQCLAYAPSLLEHVGWEKSVYKGHRHEPWKRGLLLSDDANRGDPKWQAMIDDVAKRRYFDRGREFFVDENSGFSVRCGHA